MLIGIDASRANRSRKTGTEWYSYYLIRWLAKLDNKNQYILYTDAPLYGGLLDLTSPQYLPNTGCYEKVEFDENGFQIIKSSYNNFKAKILHWPFSYFWTQGRLSLEMLLHKVDLLFVSAHTLPLIHPKNSVVTIHDIAFERNVELYQKEKIKNDIKTVHKLIDFLVRFFSLGKYRATNLDYLRWSTRYGLKHATKIITVSNYTKNDVMQFYGSDGDKIQVVYNGYNRFLYRKIEDKDKIKKVLAKYDIIAPFFLYVGRIEKKKNIPRLIEAFSIFKQTSSSPCKLVLVGDASFGYDETSYMINEFALNDDIIIPGWVPEEDLPYLFNAATSFVFPSNYEGFGIPLLQAMACGVPIITSCSTSIPEIVGDAALLFNPLSVESIAETMRKIMSDDNLKNDLINKGNNRIINFSWQKCAEETLELLNSFKV